MTELFALRALLFAGECLAASLLLLGAAAIAVRFLKPAGLRHLVWLTAFGTMLVLPLAALVLPPQIAIHHRAEAAAAEPVAVPSASAIPMLPPAAQPAWNVGAKDVALALFAVWLLGFGWSVLRLLIGAIGVNALQMSSTKIDRRTMPGVAEAHGCDVRLASDGSGPMTWGTLRPVILLPQDAPSWPSERLRAALLHEMAHVRRNDALAQTLSQIACALYWPNPLAWIGARAMRRDAEIAADDAVIGAGVRPSIYASELLHLAARYRETRALAGLSMASESGIEARLKSVLTSDQTRRGVSSMDAMKIAGAGVLVTAALALARPSFAEDALPVPPMPPRAVTAAIIPSAPPAPLAMMAENDVPPAPHAPDAPPAPPSPPNAAAPPTPAESDNDIHGPVYLQGDMESTMNDAHTAMRPMTAEERRKLHAILHNMHRQIRDAMAKASPEMRRAMAELQAHREELKALRPQIEQAMRDARPQIERAIEEARKASSNANLDDRIRRHVEKAMRRVEKMHLEAARDRHADQQDTGDQADDR
jgi:beta-lactamase regulating signal transducer with metallopeptidase domain